MLNSFRSTCLLLIIVYMLSTLGDTLAPKSTRQSQRSFTRCLQNKKVSFALTWGPSEKTNSLLDAFKAKDKKAVLLVNPNMVNENNKQLIRDAFSKSQTVGMQIPLWPEELAAMSALEFATRLKEFADRISVAMNFAGQFPKYIRIPNISKDICLIDTTPMIQIANAMGFVVIQNTKGNGDLLKVEDASIMTNYMADNLGYIFSIEDSETNTVDGSAVAQILASAEGQGYSIVPINECVGLSAESSLKTCTI